MCCLQILMNAAAGAMVVSRHVPILKAVISVVVMRALHWQMMAKHVIVSMTMNLIHTLCKDSSGGFRGWQGDAPYNCANICMLMLNSGRVAEWSKWWTSAHLPRVDQKDPGSNPAHAEHVCDSFRGVLANYEHCVQ